jgi:xylulokinase
MYDTAHLRWSTDMLDAMNLPRTLVPDVGGSSTVLGDVTAEAASITGLTAGTPVVGGGADNACGAAGVGALHAGSAVVSWGTSGTVLAPIAEPRVDGAMRAHTFCHVAPDTWYVMGVVLAAGAAFDWYRDRFARDLAAADVGAPDAVDRRRTASLLEAEAATVERGADGVTFLPYLQGERTPHRSASMRGAFVGLSLAHHRGHLTRAVLEGICFALLDSLSVIQDLGIRPSSLLLTGGGARSPFVRAMLAEVTGLPVAIVRPEEGPAFGAALLAAVGAGAFPDLAAAARATVVRGALETPVPESHAAYELSYRRFRAARHAAHATPSDPESAA